MTKITLKQRFSRAAGIGVAGLAVAFAITCLDNSFRGEDWFLRCAAAGAFLSGLVFAGAFGGQGPWGWFRAGLGFGAATVLGAVFAVLLLPLDLALIGMGEWIGVKDLPRSSMFGPAYVLTMMGENLGVVLLWIGALGTVQALSGPAVLQD